MTLILLAGGRHTTGKAPVEYRPGEEKAETMWSATGAASFQGPMPQAWGGGQNGGVDGT